MDKKDMKAKVRPKNEKGIFAPLAELLASKSPELKKKLKVADMKETPE